MFKNKFYRKAQPATISEAEPNKLTQPRETKLVMQAQVCLLLYIYIYGIWFLPHQNFWKFVKPKSFIVYIQYIYTHD